MTDTTKSIKTGGGGDYTTLVAWDAARAGTVASGDREIAECYSGVDSETSLFQMSASWVVSGEVIIRAAASNGHGGSPSAGFRFSNSSSYYAINVGNCENLTIDGIVIRNTNTGTDNGSIALDVAGNPSLKILNSLILRDHGTGGVAPGVRCGTAGSSTTIVNSQVLSSGVAVYLGDGLTPVGRFYNCVFVSTNGAEALYLGYGTTLTVKNCYLHSTGTVYTNIGYGTGTFTTCRHSTSQSITGSTGSTAYSTSNFTNVTSGSEDFTLPSGSALIDAGTDLSGDSGYPFSTDILGATRSGTWEVGPFNYAAASGYTITASGGSYALTGQSAGLKASRKIAAAQGSYALTGQAAALRAARKIVAAQGSYALTGQAASLRAARMLAAGQGSYAITGQAAALRLARVLAAAQGSYSLAGQVAGLGAGRRIAAVQGAYALSGQDATLSYSGAGAKTIFADHGSYSLSGQSVALRAARKITISAGGYTLTGQGAGLLFGRVLAAAQGSYSLAGQAAALRIARALAIVRGVYAITGSQVGFTYSGTLTPVSASRTYRVKFEDRGYRIRYEDRTLDIQ